MNWCFLGLIFINFFALMQLEEATCYCDCKTVQLAIKQKKKIELESGNK